MELDEFMQEQPEREHALSLEDVFGLAQGVNDWSQIPREEHGVNSLIIYRGHCNTYEINVGLWGIGSGTNKLTLVCRTTRTDPPTQLCHYSATFLEACHVARNYTPLLEHPLYNLKPPSLKTHEELYAVAKLFSFAAHVVSGNLDLVKAQRELAAIRTQALRDARKIVESLDEGSKK